MYHVGRDELAHARCEGSHYEAMTTELKNDCACVTCDPVGGSRRENLDSSDSSNKFLM